MAPKAVMEKPGAANALVRPVRAALLRNVEESDQLPPFKMPRAAKRMGGQHAGDADIKYRGAEGDIYNSLKAMPQVVAGKKKAAMKLSK